MTARKPLDSLPAELLKDLKASHPKPLIVADMLHVARALSRRGLAKVVANGERGNAGHPRYNVTLTEKGLKP